MTVWDAKKNYWKFVWFLNGKKVKFDRIMDLIKSG